MAGNNRGSRKVLIIAAAALLCAVIGGISWMHSRNAGDYKAIQSKAEMPAESAGEGTAAAAEEDLSSASGSTAEAEAVKDNTAAEAATAETAAPAEEIPIDFDTIREDCPDVYAWIRIPGTQIDYPVCQSPEGVDQDFYLSHRADGTEEFAGAIYSQNYNSKDFSDSDTILYGHDMSNGSMFQNLHFYEDRDFFDSNREVLIYLPDRVLHYRVFAAYNTNDDHILLSHDCFEDPEVFGVYLQEIFDGTSVYSGFVDQDAAATVTKESRVLTLSTCNAYNDQRFLVQCVLEE